MAYLFPNPLARLIFQELLQGKKLRVLDAGASGGGEYNRWQFLGQSLSLYGFEPEKSELAALVRNAERSGINAEYSSACIGRTEKGRKLIVTKELCSASFLKLDYAWYQRKIGAVVDGQPIRSSDSMAVDKEILVDCVSLDDWAQERGVQGIDYLKLDIEGLELEALEAAPGIFTSVLGISVDVIFHADWIGAPVFADIDAYLRKNGFYLWDIDNIKRGHQFDSPIRVPDGHAIYKSQLACANAIYFRDPISGPGAVDSQEKVLKLAAIAEVLGLVEYAFELLIFAAKREADDGVRQKIEDVAKRGEAEYRARLQQARARSFFLPVAVALQRYLPDGLWRKIVRPAGRAMMRTFSGGK
ncbi:MAG: FkbM family methyltransferase [Pseudomonadota bacterium]